MMRDGIMQMPMMGAGMWLMMLSVIVGGLLFVAAVVLGIGWVARSFRQDDATMILRRRLAEGAITEEEYRQRLSA